MIKILQTVTGPLIIGGIEEIRDPEHFYEVTKPRVLRVRDAGNGMMEIMFAPPIGNPQSMDVPFDKVAFSYEPDAELALKYREAVSGLTLVTKTPKPPGNIVPFKI